MAWVLAFASALGPLWASADEAAELRARLAQQDARIRELESRVGDVPQAAMPAGMTRLPAVEGTSVHPEPARSVAPSTDHGIEAGYAVDRGLFLRSVHTEWEAGSAPPFELRFRGRMQIPYYNYQADDTVNHFTGVDLGRQTAPDFSSIEVKRARLIFEGFAFAPELRYHFQLDGSTRGVAGLDPRQGSFSNPIGNVNGGQIDAAIDHVVRLLAAYTAYDIHGGEAGEHGYRPTYTLTIGKMKNLFGLDEYLGSATNQFVEYSMANWFFDADDDNYMTSAAVQVRHCDDRLFVMTSVTNGNETQIPNQLLDNVPGVIVGGWWDFGGSWNPEKERWNLFGDSLSDIDFSDQWVVRTGGAINLVPMGRRSEYTSAELDRVRATPGQPNAGGSLTGVLGGGGLGTGGNFSGVATGISPFAVDAFDTQSFNLFVAAKYRGCSISNEWWLRRILDFRGERNAAAGRDNPILYFSNDTAGSRFASLFPSSIRLIDFGTTLQGGYFIIPRKVELVGRASWIRGESGNINGDGSGFTTITAAQAGLTEAAPVNGVQPPHTVPIGTTVRIVNNAFRRSTTARELALGVNYFWFRELVKWQTDVSIYDGGNPAANGQSPAGFIPGVDGWMLRTQVQVAF